MNLKYLRTLKGVTQREVSEGIGCSEVAYNRYESGEREPSLDMIMRIASYFGVTTDLVLGYNAAKGELFDEYEIRLIIAARRADQRAREDALLFLETHELPRMKKG